MSAAESIPSAGTRKIASKARPPVKPAERIWRLFTALAVVAIGAWYYMAHQEPSPNRYRGLVLALGWIGIGTAVLAATISARKRIAYQGVGRMSAWLTAHVYMGILSGFAILFHSGLRTGGPLSALLLDFFSFVIISGLMGWWFSRTLPPLLTQIEERPAIMEDLLLVRSECLQGLLQLAESGSSEFRALVQRRLLKAAGSWGQMFQFYRHRSKVADELPAFRKLHADELSSLRRQEQMAYQRAIEYALRVNKMNAEILLQRTMRGWLTLHIVCTGAMFGLAAVHIFMELYY